MYQPRIFVCVYFYVAHLSVHSLSPFQPSELDTGRKKEAGGSGGDKARKEEKGRKENEVQEEELGFRLYDLFNFCHFWGKGGGKGSLKLQPLNKLRRGHCLRVGVTAD